MDTNVSGWTSKQVRLAALVALLVSGGVYLNTLWAGFTWDDQWLILDNERLTDPAQRWGYVKYMLFERTLWRPVKRISLMVDYSIWGRDHPGGFHLTNAAIESLVGLTLFLVLRRLARNDRLALIATLLFAVHPVHVEAIANISHRKEPLSLLFFLLGWLCYLRGRTPAGGRAPALESFAGEGPAEAEAGRGMTARSALYLGLFFACYLLGMLSKDVGAVMLPLTVIVYELLLRGPRLDDKLRRIAWLLLPAAPVLALFTWKGYIGSIPRRFTAENILWITSNETDHYSRVLFSAVKAFGTYLRLLIWPWPLYLDRAHSLPKSAFELDVVVGIAALALFLWGLGWAWRRSPLALFALAWYGLNLLPVTNLVPLTHWLIAERFVYVPSVGFAILLALGFDAAWRGRLKLAEPAMVRSASFSLLTLLLVGHAGLTLWQNGVWKNSMTLWGHTLQYNDRSFRGLYGYGLELDNAGESQEAEKYYKKSIAVLSSYPEAHYALGLLMLKEERYDEAIREATVHSDLAPKDPEPFIIIGNAHFGRQNYAQAAVAYQKAIDRKPGHMDARYNLANALYGAGHYQESLNALDEALRLRPQATLWHLRGSVLEQMHLPDEAVDSYKQARAADPQSVTIQNDLAMALYRNHRLEEAAAEMSRSLGLKPDQPQIRKYLEAITAQLR